MPRVVCLFALIVFLGYNAAATAQSESPEQAQWHALNDEAAGRPSTPAEFRAEQERERAFNDAMGRAMSGEPQKDAAMGVVAVQAMRELFRTRAEQGFAPAQFALGTFYDDGHGVPPDYQQAVTWYRKAAEQGNADAQISLGLHYESAKGVPQDHTEAAKWFRKAAEQGNSSAQYWLGLLYGIGAGVTKDYEEAYFWEILASKVGDKEIADLRDRGERLLTPQQVADVQKRAREWKPTPAQPATSDKP